MGWLGDCAHQPATTRLASYPRRYRSLLQLICPVLSEPIAQFSLVVKPPLLSFLHQTLRPCNVLVENNRVAFVPALIADRRNVRENVRTSGLSFRIGRLHHDHSRWVEYPTDEDSPLLCRMYLAKSITLISKIARICFSCGVWLAAIDPQTSTVPGAKSPPGFSHHSGGTKEKRGESPP